MKKYLELYKNYLQMGTAYRTDAFNWLIIATVSTIASIILLRTVASVGGFPNYTPDQITAYVVLSLVLERFLTWYLSYTVPRHIEKGNLNNQLIKPFNVKLNYFLGELGYKTTMTLFYLVIVALFFVVLKIKIPITPQILIKGYISLLLGSVISLQIALCLVAIAFWTIRASGFISVFMLIIGYLEGRFLPLDIFPSWLLHILQFTPFPYTYFYTIKLFIGDPPQNFSIYVLTQMFWLVLLYFFMNLVWKLGIKKYESVGI